VDTAERIAEFLPKACRRRTVSIGGRELAADGISVFLSGIPFAPFNPTVVVEMPADPDAALAKARELHRASGVPFGIDLDADLHAPVRDAAARASLTVIESRPAMAIGAADVAVTAPLDGLRIETVVEPLGLDAVAAIDAVAFESPPEVVRRFLGDGVLDEPTQSVYLATLDGEPVGCGETTTLEGVIGVFGVATLPAARRRGIGAAITAHMVRDRAAEADLAVLDASDLGFGVYERLGFRSVATWEVWGEATPPRPR